MKQIHLNGTLHETSARDVAELMRELGFEKGMVMVEHNGVALHVSEWKTAIHAGDKLELMRIAAGG